jgi:hypothetical protein
MTSSFTREQFKYIVAITLDAALDRIQTGLPDIVDWDDRTAHNTSVDPDPLKLNGYERGALETAGEVLACLQAPLTQEGMGIGDCLAVAGKFDEACGEFVRQSWANQGADFKAAVDRMRVSRGPFEMKYIYQQFGYPDVEKHAEAFVESVYLI